MTESEEKQLASLCKYLARIESKFDLTEMELEALRKAAIALSLAYIFGLRERLELRYSELGTVLSSEEVERFKLYLRKAEDRVERIRSRESGEAEGGGSVPEFKVGDFAHIP